MFFSVCSRNEDNHSGSCFRLVEPSSAPSAAAGRVDNVAYAYYQESTINYVSITRVNCINHSSDLAAKIKRRLPSVLVVKNEGVATGTAAAAPPPLNAQLPDCSTETRRKPVRQLLLSRDTCGDCHKFNAVDMELQTFWKQPLHVPLPRQVSCKCATARRRLLSTWSGCGRSGGRRRKGSDPKTRPGSKSRQLLLTVINYVKIRFKCFLSVQTLGEVEE